MTVLFINGAPGCGKTYQLTKLFAESAVSARAYFAFTEAAKDEALQRLAAKGIEVHDRVSQLIKNAKPVVCTIHAFALYIYLNYIKGATQRDRSDYEYEFERIRKEVCQKNGIAYIPTDPTTPGHRLFLEFERQRNMMQEIDYDLIANKACVPSSRAKAAIEQYYDLIRRTDWGTDFTGLLEALVEHKYKISDFCAQIFIDEFQDLTPLQLALFEFNGRREIVVAGDIDQTVYQFMGVDIKRIYEIYSEARKQHLAAVRRVPQNIFELAKRVRAMMIYKADYKPESVNSTFGQLVECASLEEAINYALQLPGEKLILCYRNEDARQAYLHLVRYHGIVPQMLSKRKFTAIRKLCEVVSTVQEVLQNNNNENIFYAMLDNPPLRAKIEHDGLGTQDISKLLQLLDNECRRVLGAPFASLPKLRPRNDVKIDTVHEAKGREADVVVVYDYYPRLRFETGLEETDAQAKLLYVALTRTRRDLIIARKRTSRGQSASSLLYKFLSC